MTIDHTRCVLHDGPLDEADQIAVAPGQVIAKSLAAVPPTVTNFSYDPMQATLRLCLRMVWSYDTEPNVDRVEEVCTTPANIGTTRLAV